MVLSDPSIDPITGLPVLNPSGPIQQIPLGQEVFPYADLNATAQPTRGPIYGDDIIPTSGLVTAPDVQMKPRSIQSTTTRELRVREAVFQSNGAAIADGTTAPVDVNVVSGGGGGGITPIVMQHNRTTYEAGSSATDPTAFLQIPANMRYLYSISGAVIVEGTAPPVNQGVNFTLGIGGGGSFGIFLPLWSDMTWNNGTDPFVDPVRLPVTWYPCAPLDLWSSLDNSGNWWMTLSWTSGPHITRVDFTTAWIWGN